MSSTGTRPSDGPIERADPADLAMLATERAGRAPAHVGAVLLLDANRAVSPGALLEVLAERVTTVPRLRQRLTRVPPVCGRPIWVDDPAFDVTRHVRTMGCPYPGDEQALLDLAAVVAGEPLPQSCALWRAVLVLGSGGDPIGLVLVVHHALADGIGALQILDQLVDGGDGGPAEHFPLPPPPWSRLAVDAARTRCRTLARANVTWRELCSGSAAIGGVRAPRAARCSILRPTGSRRRLLVVRADLAAVHALGHRQGGSVNDVLLAAIAGALYAVLRRRGERVDEFRVAVMVGAGRPGDRPGNRAAPLVVGVPAAGPLAERLARVAGVVAAARAAAAGRPAIAMLQPLFRVVAEVGLYRFYLRHQRRLHTLVSNVRGPARPLTIAGAPVVSVVPLTVGEAGNLTVQFLALSYAGTLTVTIVADADEVPDLPELAAALQAELTGRQVPDNGPDGSGTVGRGGDLPGRAGRRSVGRRECRRLGIHAPRMVRVTGR